MHVEQCPTTQRRRDQTIIPVLNNPTAAESLASAKSSLATAEIRLAEAKSGQMQAESRLAVLESRVTVLERPVRTYSSLLFFERFSDVVFICGGTGGDRIHAHRCVVAACSEQLSALLQGQWAETTGGERERVAEVEMSQSGAAVREMLRFMYTGEAEAAALDGNLQEVLELAALYEQADLKAACEERGLAGLQVKTVVPLLVTAHLHDLGKANMAKVMMSPLFMSLKTQHPLLWRETQTALDAQDDGGEEEEGGEGPQGAKVG